jgi:hypothetical protein
LLAGHPGLLQPPAYSCTSGGTSLPASVERAGAVPCSCRRCTETRLQLSTLSLGPISRTSLRLFQLSNPSSGSNAPRLHCSPAIIESSASQLLHRPKVSRSLSPFPRPRLKLIGRTLACPAATLDSRQGKARQGEATTSSRCRLVPTRNVLGAPRYVSGVCGGNVTWCAQCPSAPVPLCLVPSQQREHEQEEHVCEDVGWAWRIEATVDGGWVLDLECGWLVPWRSGAPSCLVPPAVLSRTTWNLVHLPEPGRGPLSDAILQALHIHTTVQGTQVLSTLNQYSSATSPAPPNHRQPCPVAHPSYVCAHILGQHVYLSLFIVSASRPAASSQPAFAKNLRQCHPQKARQQALPEHDTSGDGILSVCHQGPAQEAKTLFVGGPSPNSCLVLLLPRTGPRRHPAATRSSSRRSHELQHYSILSSTREPVTTVGPALTHPTPPSLASRLESPL